MNKWKSTMPKQPADEGKSHFVFSFKTASGERIEYTGQAPTPDLCVALRSLQEMMIRTKNLSNPSAAQSHLTGAAQRNSACHRPDTKDDGRDI